MELDKKTFFLFIALGIIIAAGIFAVNILSDNTPTSTLGAQEQVEKTVPSESVIEYVDPAGFTFNYPDNLSLEKNEGDDSTYADLQLSSKKVNGSLSLRITDSEFKTIDDWVKSNQSTPSAAPKDVMLGNLKAIELRNNDRLLVGAVDQGIFFSIEIPLIEEEFWMKVYDKVLSSFSFASPEQENSASTESYSSPEEVVFEGEEVVE